MICTAVIFGEQHNVRQTNAVNSGFSPTFDGAMPTPSGKIKVVTVVETDSGGGRFAGDYVFEFGRTGIASLIG